MAKHEKDETLILGKEVSRVATALEWQNRFRNKLLMGILFGVGTAVGASIVATIVFVLFAKTLQFIGVSPEIFTPDSTKTLLQD